MKYWLLLALLICAIIMILMQAEIRELQQIVEYKNIVIDEWRVKWKDAATSAARYRSMATDWRLQFFACQKTYTKLKQECIDACKLPTTPVHPEDLK